MLVNKIGYPVKSFTAQNNSENPISKSGERKHLLAATAVAGLGVGGRALFYLWENDFALGDLFNAGAKLVDKNKKNVTGTKKNLLYLGAFAAMTAGFIAAVAAVYTAFKTPEIMYDGKVNAFKKGKDMNVYVKGNEVEKELYNQMLEKAKNASPEEKKRLYKQYLILKASKNEVPDSVKVPSKN